MVRADGTPLIQRYVVRTVSKRCDVPCPGWQRSAGPQGECRPACRRFPASASPGLVTFPLDGSARVGRFSDGQTPPNLWYFVHDGARDGRGYFVGYDSQSKLCVGFIGRDGFRPDQPPVEQWFPMDGAKLASDTAFSRSSGATGMAIPTSDGSRSFPRGKCDMISGAQLLEVDLRNGSVTTLMESPDLIAVGMLDDGFDSEGRRGGVAARHTATGIWRSGRADRVLVFDAPGKQHAAFLLPEELRDRSIDLYELDAGRALRYGRSPASRSQLGARNFPGSMPSGKVLRRAEVPLAGGNGRNDANSVDGGTGPSGPGRTRLWGHGVEPLDAWRSDWNRITPRPWRGAWPYGGRRCWSLRCCPRRWPGTAAAGIAATISPPAAYGSCSSCSRAFRGWWPISSTAAGRSWRSVRPAGISVPRDRETCASCAAKHSRRRSPRAAKCSRDERVLKWRVTSPLSLRERVRVRAAVSRNVGLAGP